FGAGRARRAVRKAYDVLAARFAERFAPEEPEPDEQPKVEMLADDDFEATVFEEAPVAHRADTSVSHEIQIEDIVALDDHSTSSESVIAPPPPRDRDETMERHPVAPGPRDSGNWTVSVVSAAIQTPAPDEWVVTNVAGAVPRGMPEIDHGDDGTPIEGVTAAGAALPVVENNFVAGEIDVPNSAPVGEKETPVDFTAASSLLGQPEPAPDPDTGRRTPPIERR